MDYTIWAILAVVVVYLIIYFVVPNQRKFECPGCKKTFSPKKLQLVLAPHIGAKKMLKCPYCGKRAAMSKIHRK